MKSKNNSSVIHWFRCLVAGMLLFGVASGTFAAEGFPMRVASESGRFDASFNPLVETLPLREIHRWSLKIFRNDGTEVQPQRLEIQGGMPRHGHGLPSAPRVSHYFGGGEYQIDGMLFNMPGMWQLKVELLDDQGWDTAVINFPVRTVVVPTRTGWTDSELGLIKSMRLRKPTSAESDYLTAELGQKLFFDKTLSPSGIACSHCHQPQHFFADGLKTSQGISPLRRNSPSLIGISQSAWFYWDGRRDSLWSQALVPFEAAAEMGSSRIAVLQKVMSSDDYRQAYEKIFKKLPNPDKLMILPKNANPLGTDEDKRLWRSVPRRDRNEINLHYANIGKLLEAYMSKLQHQDSRFDQFVDALVKDGQVEADKVMTADEQQGLRWFISGQSRCLNCHNGPRFTNDGFHNIGTAENAEGERDFGRALGIQSALLNEFNCKSKYANSNGECAKLDYISAAEITGMLDGSFKVPGLRNVARTAPYMHDGRFADLASVLEYYRSPPDKSNGLETHELTPLKTLDDKAIGQIEAFLKTLNSPAATNSPWFKKPQ